MGTILKILFIGLQRRRKRTSEKMIKTMKTIRSTYYRGSLHFSPRNTQSCHCTERRELPHSISHIFLLICTYTGRVFRCKVYHRKLTRKNGFLSHKTPQYIHFIVITHNRR
uniref:Uncharacterized protein n=1 Tax=Cacopsylla melanoneura TaxID=428564 RepID=A0A8D8R531_9HEMI